MENVVQFPKSVVDNTGEQLFKKQVEQQTVDSSKRPVYDKDNVLYDPDGKRRFVSQWNKFDLEEYRKIGKWDYENVKEQLAFAKQIEISEIRVARIQFLENVLDGIKLFLKGDARSDKPEYKDAVYWVLLYYVEQLFPDIILTVSYFGTVIFHYRGEGAALSKEAGRILILLASKAFKAALEHTSMSLFDLYREIFLVEKEYEELPDRIDREKKD